MDIRVGIHPARWSVGRGDRRIGGIHIRQTALIIIVLLIAGFFILSHADQIDSYALPEKPIAKVSRGGEREFMTLECTAYTHTGNLTYSETHPHRGTIAADTSVLPIGTRLYIPGYGYGVVEDTGGAIKEHKLDLFMDTAAECWRYGRQTVQVEILN